MRLPHLPPLAAALLLIAATSAAAADFVEPATGTRFDSAPTVDDTEFQCLGAGAPVSGGYALTYCIEVEQAEAIDSLIQLVYPHRSGSSLERTLAADQSFFDALSEIPGDKLVVLHLARDTSRDQLAQVFRKALSGQLADDKIAHLEGLVTRGGAQGDTVLIYTHGAQVTVDVAGAAKTLEDDEIASTLWETWLGPKSASPALKSSIAHTAASESLPWGA